MRILVVRVESLAVCLFAGRPRRPGTDGHDSASQELAALEGRRLGMWVTAWRGVRQLHKKDLSSTFDADAAWRSEDCRRPSAAPLPPVCADALAPLLRSPPRRGWQRVLPPLLLLLLLNFF